VRPDPIEERWVGRSDLESRALHHVPFGGNPTELLEFFLSGVAGTASGFGLGHDDPLSAFLERANETTTISA